MTKPSITASDSGPSEKLDPDQKRAMGSLQLKDTAAG